LESNWRFWVWDVGMSASTWRLCSRILNVPAEFHWWLVDGTAAGYRSIYRIVPGQLPEFVDNVPAFGGFPGNIAFYVVAPD